LQSIADALSIVQTLLRTLRPSMYRLSAARWATGWNRPRPAERL
jgi:hypothetical protein